MAVLEVQGHWAPVSEISLSCPQCRQPTIIKLAIPLSVELSETVLMDEVRAVLDRELVRNITALQVADVLDQVEWCPDHDQYPLDRWCWLCRTARCFVCQSQCLENHHPVESMTSAVHVLKNQVNDRTQQLNALEDQLKKYQLNEQQNKQQIYDDIDRAYNYAVAKLQREMEKLRAECDQKWSEQWAQCLKEVPCEEVQQHVQDALSKLGSCQSNNQRWRTVEMMEAVRALDASNALPTAPFMPVTGLAFTPTTRRMTLGLLWPQRSSGQKRASGNVDDIETILKSRQRLDESELQERMADMELHN